LIVQGLWESARKRAGDGLEAGAVRGPAALLLSAAYGRLATVERPLDVPGGVGVVGISGATLGGSGVTALVIDVAAALSLHGRRVAVIGHGYGASNSMTRVVSPLATVAEDGDEAVEVARALRSRSVPVVVGRPRCAAVALAARGADTLVLDGVLQTRPSACAASLLALEAWEPWGSGACPPVGNLRASPEKLIRAASAVLWLTPPGASPGRLDGRSTLEGFDRPLHVVPSDVLLFGGGFSGAPLADLGRGSVGVILGVARPERISRALAHAGVGTEVVVRLSDHASAQTFQRHERQLRGAKVDLWVTTSKCATKLGDRFAGRPVVALRRRFRLPAALLDGLLSTPPAADGRGACLSARGRAMVRPCSGTV
jgi:tetraacyldisaccharide 4'-kinase